MKEKLKLDLACGNNKRDGYHGVDFVKTPSVDEVVNLLRFPWPWETDSVEAVHCSHFVEHIPHQLPLIGETKAYAERYGTREGFFVFFDELHRVCANDAVIDIYHPYALNSRAFQDPTHRRFIPEATWYYLDTNWRAANGLHHYQTSCDFEVVTIEGVGVNAAFQNRNQETVDFARGHYWHIIDDLHVVLRARK